MATQTNKIPSAPTPAVEVEAYKKPKYAPKRLFDPPIVKRAIVDAVPQA